MISRQQHKELSHVLIDLCQAHHLTPYLLVLDHSKMPKRAYGVCIYKQHIISIASDINYKKAEQTVYHEFEHAFQYKHYRTLCELWWNKQHNREYYMYYRQFLNVLEADARVFGRSLGQRNLRQWLEFYTPEQLECYWQNNCLHAAQAKLFYRATGNWIDPDIWQITGFNFLKRIGWKP